MVQNRFAKMVEESVKFSFYYHKTANLFHFIANLSSWDPGYNPRFSKAWLQKTGPLSSEEEGVLREVVNLIPTYERMPETTSYLKFLFFTPEVTAIWDKVSDLITVDELKTIKKAFRIFEPRFGVIWGEEKESLARWRTVLDKRVADPELRRLERDMRTFFRCSKPDPKLNICLLLSGGGVFMGNNQGYLTVALKCSAVPLARSENVVAVLYHESSHAFYERPVLRDLTSKFVTKLREPYPKIPLARSGEVLWTTLVEATVSNLLPEGYLAHRYLGRPAPSKPKKGSKTNFSNWRLYSATQMFDLTKNYIETRKPLDMNYMNHVWETLKDFAKEYSSK